jgi:hypothetical protein
MQHAIIARDGAVSKITFSLVDGERYGDSLIVYHSMVVDEEFNLTLSDMWEVFAILAIQSINFI